MGRDVHISFDVLKRLLILVTYNMLTPPIPISKAASDVFSRHQFCQKLLMSCLKLEGTQYAQAPNPDLKASHVSSRWGKPKANNVFQMHPEPASRIVRRRGPTDCTDTDIATSVDGGQIQNVHMTAPKGTSSAMWKAPSYCGKHSVQSDIGYQRFQMGCQSVRSLLVLPPLLKPTATLVLSSASSAVTYTSVYTDSEPERPVAPPSPDYIPGPEEPQTPPVPQDKDEHETMFIQPHDPDYVPEPMYPEYIPLEDEHVLPTEEQPLPPIDSPTAKSSGYVVESDPEEDLEEYEDDETEDGPTLRMASTQALIDAVTVALPSPPLPPPLYISLPVDRRDDIPETEMPPHPVEAVPEIAPMTMGEVNTRVTELAELHKHNTHDLYALLEDAQDSRTRISQRVTMDSQWVDLLMEDRISHQETILIVEDEACAAREAWAHSIGLSQAVHFELHTHREQAEISELRETDCRRQAQMVKTLRVMGDMRREMGDMQAELRIMVPVTRQGPNIPANNTNPNNMTPESVQAMIDQALLRNSTNRDGSHSLHEDNRRNVQTARPCFYADFMKCQPLNFKGTEGMVKFATCTLVDTALTWWNSQIRSLGPDAYSMTWEVLKKKMTDKYCPQGEIKKLEIELWNLKVKGNDVPAYTERFQELTLICTKFVANETEKIDKYIDGLPERQTNNKRKADDSFRNNHGHQQQPAKSRMSTRSTIWDRVKRNHMGETYPSAPSAIFITMAHALRNATSATRENPKENGCFECGAPGYFKRDCPKLKNKDEGNVNAQGWVYAVGNTEKKGNASRDPDSNVVTGNSYDVELADGKIVRVDTIMWGCTLNFLNHPFNIDLMPVELGSFDVIIGMDWLRRCYAVIVCDEKLVRAPYRDETLIFHGDEIFLAHIFAKKEEDKSEGMQLKDVPIV
nr:hypothetical protein [Tanacetum cinerariifolium]